MTDKITEDEIQSFAEQLESGAMFVSADAFNADVTRLLAEVATADSGRAASVAVLEFAASSPAPAYTQAVINDVVRLWTLYALREVSPLLISVWMRHFNAFVITTRSLGGQLPLSQINPVEQGDPNRGTPAADSE